MNKIWYNLSIVILIGIFYFLNIYIGDKGTEQISNSLNDAFIINLTNTITNIVNIDYIIVILLFVLYFNKSDKTMVIYYWFVLINSSFFIEFISFIMYKLPPSLKNNFNSLSCSCYFSTPNRHMFYSFWFIKVINYEINKDKEKLSKIYQVILFMLIFIFSISGLKSLSNGNETIFDYIFGLLLGLLYYRFMFNYKNSHSILAEKLNKSLISDNKNFILLLIIFNLILNVIFMLVYVFIINKSKLELDNNIFCNRACYLRDFSTYSIKSTNNNYLLIGLLFWIYSKNIKLRVNVNNIKKFIFSLIFRIIIIFQIFNLFLVLDEFYYYNLYVTYFIKSFTYFMVGYLFPIITNFLLRIFYLDYRNDLGRIQMEIN